MSHKNPFVNLPRPLASANRSYYMSAIASGGRISCQTRRRALHLIASGEHTRSVQGVRRDTSEDTLGASLFGRDPLAMDPPMATMPLNEDLLTGAEAIAAYLGWPTRRVYYHANRRYLPIRHVGSLLVARKSELDRALSGVEVA